MGDTHSEQYLRSGFSAENDCPRRESDKTFKGMNDLIAHSSTNMSHDDPQDENDASNILEDASEQGRCDPQIAA
jgi:hypothetical protein